MFWFSPAKINLFLHVLGKRPDGYHELLTRMQTVSLGDFISFDKSEYDSMVCSNPCIPTDSSNLIWKAVYAFRSATGWDEPLSIQLDKNIPSEAGLAGGSSNAATMLWAMNATMGFPLTIDQLILLAEQIGSDVPFFFNYGGAICSGRGEIMVDCDSSRKKYTIVKPPYGLSTREVFALSKVGMWGGQVVEGKEFYNDLEVPAFLLRPELAELKRKLVDRGFDRVVMTGSGSALICEGEGDPMGLGAEWYEVGGIGRFTNEWYSIQEASFNAGL